MLAVLAIAQHQRRDPGGAVQIKEIASQYDLPPEYTAKLLTTLAKSRILVSLRGRDGGFALRRRASEISVLNIVEAVDGPLEAVDVCGPAGDRRDGRASVSTLFDTALTELRAMLEKRTIESLLDG